MQQCMQKHLHKLTTTTAVTTTTSTTTRSKALKLQNLESSCKSYHCDKRKNNRKSSNKYNNKNNINQNLKLLLNNNNTSNNNSRAEPNTRRKPATNSATTTAKSAAVTANTATTKTTVTTARAPPAPDCNCTVHNASIDCSSSNGNNSISNSRGGSNSKMPSITLDAVVPHSYNIDSVVAVASDPVAASDLSSALQTAASACTDTTTTALCSSTARKTHPPHSLSLGEQVAADAAAQVSPPPPAPAGPPTINALRIAAQRAAAATYGCHFQGAAASAFLPTASSALEQYRLQLYNYALNIERLRCPQYSAAAAMAAASYASSAVCGHATANRHHMASNGNTYSMPVGMPTASRLALSMSLFPQRIFQPEEPKPQHSYIGLIAMAILSSAESKLVLSDIYQYILDNYPYFRTRGPGWRNSIRHNLSLNDCFIKSGRSANGKGHYWAIHPANMDDFRKGDFRRRKAQRKVRKHMGLSVDDAGTDSPSPPPLDLSASPPAGATHPLTAHHLAASHTFGYLQHQHHHNHQHNLQQQQQQPHHQYQLPHLSVVPASFQTPHPQHHHYIGQAFGNAAGMAATVNVPHYTSNAPAGANSNNGSSGVQQLSLAQSYAYSNSSSNNNNSHFDNSSQQHNQPAQQPSDSNAAVTADGNQLAIINETTTTTRTATASVIANLYSQTRKRQFDVASLLAPEVKVDFVDDNCALTTIERCSPNGGIATTTQHTVITKVSVQQQQHHHHHLPYHHQHHYYQQQQLSEAPAQQPRSLQELDEQEDIDVVASDVEDHQRQPSNAYTYADVNGDADGEGDGDTDADAEGQQCAEADAVSYLSTSRRSSIEGCATDAANSSRHQSPLSDGALELRTLQLPSSACDAVAAANELQSNSLSSQPDSLECTTLVSVEHSRESSPSGGGTGGAAHVSPVISAMAQEQHVQRLMQQLQQQQQTVSSKLSGVDSHFFGRYYGTYMAAAAAHRIGSISLTQLQPTIETTQMQHHLKQQQQRHTQ